MNDNEPKKITDKNKEIVKKSMNNMGRLKRPQNSSQNNGDASASPKNSED